MSPVVRRTVFVFALLVTTILMLIPSPGSASSNDKVDHVLVFATLTLLGSWARIGLPRLAAGLIVYAFVTELLQGTATRVRHGDLADVAADVVGICVGVMVIGLVASFRRARRASSDPSRPPG